MCRRTILTSIVFLAAALAVASAQQPVEIKVTQKHLTPLCLNGSPIKSGVRSWKLPPNEYTMVFRMRNAPRKGMVATPSSGRAAITFKLEPGHKYEIEARAGSSTFSSRVWEKGAWSPIVRDRTEDRVLPAQPKWVESDCGT